MKKSLILNPKSVNRRQLALFAAIFAAIGLIVVVVVLAAGPFATSEPENAALTGGAEKVSRAGASGGQTIKFGAATTPAPTPTPTPTPTPVPTATPPAGSPPIPNYSNTGYPAGTNLQTWTGPKYDSRSNLVIDGYNLVGSYTFTGNNVTLRNCNVEGPLLSDGKRGGSGILFNGDNIRLERCTIQDGISLSGVAGAVIQYNRIHDFGSDAVHMTSDTGQVQNIDFSHNYVHIPDPEPGAHADGMQVRGAKFLTVYNNTIDMGPWKQVNGQDVLNSAIFLQDANGGNSDVTLNRNYLYGAGYTLYVGVGPRTKITNNRFGSNYKYGLVNNTSRAGDIIDKSGNVMDVTGAPVTF